MKMTKRCGTTAAGLLLAAALLLAGCEEAVEKPLNGNGPAPAPEAPDDTPRPPKTKPTDPKPAHRATGVELNTKLEWSAASGATSYQVYFGMDTTPDELKGNPVETTFDPGKLEHDTIYYWRVDSKNKIGTITGAVWWFRTEPTPTPKPEKATTLYPAHEATDISRDITLEWNDADGATSYFVYLGTAASPDRNKQLLEQTGTTFKPDKALQYDTTYYWRVDSKNAGGITNGDVWSFTTEAKPAAKATHPQPRDGATDVDTRDDLSWDEAPGATHYVVYLGTDRPLGAAQRNEEQNIEFDAMLAHNTTYYWRVDTKNEGGAITSGDVWSFTTVADAASSSFFQ